MNSISQSDSEKLLYKLILQFAFYTQGSNEQLDPHLINISKNLKQGASHLQLHPELFALSKTLTHIANNERLQNTAPLPADQNRDKDQKKYFITRLNTLLSESEIPPKFQGQCALLKKRIQGELDDSTYKKIIDSSLSLLVNIKNNALTEQLSVESFLFDISNHLDSLEEITQDASESNTQSIGNMDDFDNIIEQQVDNIKNSSDHAIELSSLQENINQHLKELNIHFHKHRKIEDIHQKESQKKLSSMSEKLQDMEIEVKSLRNNLKLTHDKAYRDALTNLPNRLAYDERISIEFQNWQRYKTPLTLLLWDIDLFKLINDHFGHKAGDKTLALVAQLIEKNSRKPDFIARYGGEEFIMILPNTNSDEAMVMAEKIRIIIANSGFNHHGDSINLTISCGMSQFSEDDTDVSVFERADQALYQSKEQGRNQCSVIRK